MPDPCELDDANVQGFLKPVRYAEHYPDESDDFYFSLYGGGRFVDPSTHPNIAVTKGGHTSTAAGAYQILYGTRDEARRRGHVVDVSAASQDTLVFNRVRFRHALAAVCSGDMAAASILLAQEWTALPGASESRMTLATAQTAFARYGGSKR